MEDDKKVSEEEITLLNHNVEELEKEKKSLVTEMEILQANYNQISYSNSRLITKPLRAIREHIIRNKLTERKTISRLLIRFGLFVFAFIIMAINLFPRKDIFGYSGDAVETWKVVTTFFNSKPYISYVMYKGVMAFLPNLVFYHMSLFFKLDQFFFVKLFNCAGFAYITTVGLPYFFSYILKEKIENYKIFIMTVILYFGIGVNFSFISVDFPSILVMMLVVNSVIRIKLREKKLPLIYYLYMGAVFSVCFLYSGQYIPVVICALLFIFFDIFIPMLKKKEIRLRVLAVLACFAVGFSIVKASDNYFIKTRVDPPRAAGAWIPTGSVWLHYAMTNGMLYSKYPLTIPDNRGNAILIKEKAPIEQIKQGGGSFTLQHYAKLVLKYPVDFTIRWLERLFLGISVDNDKSSVIFLLASYTLLFLSLLTLKRRCLTLRSVFNSRAFLILAFILPSLVPCLMHVEMRYFMSIQILIAGAALLSDTLWKELWGFGQFAKRLTVQRESNGSVLGDIKINYAFVNCIVFVTLCFMVFASQYELLGPGIGILFHW